MTEAASQISENWQRKMVFSVNRLGEIVSPKKKKKKKKLALSQIMYMQNWF